MKFDLVKASKKLSELELKINIDNLRMDVLWFRVMFMQNEWCITRHTHSSYEFHFIASGACRVILDDGEFEVSAGEFYLTAPSVYHEQKYFRQNGLTEYSINFDLELTDDNPSEARYLVQALNNCPCKPFKDTTGIMKLFDKALREAYEQKSGFHTNIKCLAAMILTASVRAMKCCIPVHYCYPVKTGKDDYRLDQIQRFIEDNIFNPISTKDIAGFLFLSDKQVCRIVKEKKGLSTKEFIMSIKLQKAKELLSASNLSVKQIAQHLGFSSEYYFSQFFKREEGYPPGIFRKNVQNT